MLVIFTQKKMQMMICMHAGEQKCQNGPENQVISKLRFENRIFLDSWQFILDSYDLSVTLALGWS